MGCQTDQKMENKPFKYNKIALVLKIREPSKTCLNKEIAEFIHGEKN